MSDGYRDDGTGTEDWCVTRITDQIAAWPGLGCGPDPLADFGRECQHGNLRRACNVCEVLAERTALESRLRTTAEALRAFVDSRRESGWAIAAGKNAGPALNKALPAVHRDDVAEIERLHEQMERGTAALRVAFGEELWRLGHPAYVVVHLRDEIERLSAEVARLTADNDWLRAYTSQSAKACVYCGLGADEQGRCERGFPGCARADDQMLCREVGVALERDALRAENEALRKDAETLQRVEKRIEELWDTVAPVSYDDPGSYRRGRTIGTADTLDAIRDAIYAAKERTP